MQLEQFRRSSNSKFQSQKVNNNNNRNYNCSKLAFSRQINYKNTGDISIFFFFFTANSIEILMGCHNRLVQPRLASNQSLSGRILKRIFTQRTIYIRPERQLLEIDHTVSNYFNTVSIIFTYSECIHGVKFYIMHACLTCDQHFLVISKTLLFLIHFRPMFPKKNQIAPLKIHRCHLQG